jgi:hypothetical protein
MLYIGSEANLDRADEIRENLRRLSTTPRLSAAELEALRAETPAVVWIMIVDTDEEAGVEVLQEVAWELATREDQWSQSMRDEVMVVMTPLTNPDSHARYVTWHGLYDVEGAETDPLAVENRAHWGMNTDGNAWGVDVNRDFGFFVTPEMRALGREMVRWRPPLLLDIHSGPAVIFLPPFPRPYHPLWPAQAPEWWEAVARRANERFGEKGWSFSSRKDYEGVAGVGFGLSWAMLGTSVSSFLFETFGGRPGRTTAFIRSDGTKATMRMAMDRHKEGVWSVLDVARDQRERLLRDAHERVAVAVEEALRSPARGVALPVGGPETDPSKVARLVDRLLLQEIDVRRTVEPVTVSIRDFYSLERAERREIPAGSYVVDFAQPMSRLARALLDPTLDFTSPEVEVPYDRRMPYYDAPWGNLPHLFGVRAWVLEQPIPANAMEPVREAPTAEGAVRWLDTTPSLPAAGSQEPAAQGPSGPPYAWVLEPGLEANMRLAVRLMTEGYRIRVFRTGFRVGDRTFPKGTLAALRIRNPESLEDRIRTLATELGAHAWAMPGPFTDAGLTFGDDQRLAAVPAPRVAVVADWPVTQDHTFGGIRSTLEADFGFPFSPVMLETLSRADLSGYTAVVLPHAGMDVRGGPNFNPGYRGRLSLGNLRDYVEGGGTLLAVQGAAGFIAQDSTLGRGVRMDGWAERTEAAVRAEWVSKPTPQAEVVIWRPGLDDFGLPLLAAGFREGDFTAPASFPVLLGVEEGEGAEVVARYASDPARLVLDGFMLDEDRPVLAGRPFVVVQRIGNGRVIYFAEDPTFRGQWYGLNLLFLNCLVLGPVG